MAINLNEMAVEISKREGKIEEVNIAQIKEVLKYALEILSEEEKGKPGSVIRLLERRFKK